MRTRGRVGEKNYCFQKALRHPGPPRHTRARPLRPRSWTNFVAGGKGLRQALEKFLQFFDKALHLDPPAFSGSSVPRSRGELTTRRASYELTLVAFVPVPGIRKTRAIIHIRGANVCAYVAQVVARTKNILPLLLSFLRETTFPLNFQRRSCRRVPKITSVEVRLNFVNRLPLMPA